MKIRVSCIVAFDYNPEPGEFKCGTGVRLYGWKLTPDIRGCRDVSLGGCDVNALANAAFSCEGLRKPHPLARCARYRGVPLKLFDGPARQRVVATSRPARVLSVTLQETMKAYGRLLLLRRRIFCQP